MSNRTRKTFVILVAVAAAVLALVAAARIRARYLPYVPVPVLYYERIESSPAGKYSVSGDLFYLQLRDLSRRGYTSVAPWRLLAYKKWGVPLPDKPLVITFDRAYRDLPEKAGQYLEDQNFTAVILLATSLVAAEPKLRRNLDGAEMMTWEEVREAMRGDTFTFGGHTRSRADLTLSENPFNEIRASRSDIKKNTGVMSDVFSYPFGKFTPEIRKAAKRAKIKFAMTHGNEVAQIGYKTDMLAVPRIPVVGGRQSFAAEANESRSPENYGFLTVNRRSGPAFPMNVSVFYGANPHPVARETPHDSEDLNFCRLTLPYPKSGNVPDMFPIRVEVRDTTGVLLYLSTEILEKSVKRTYGTMVNIPEEFDLGEIE